MISLLSNAGIDNYIDGSYNSTRITGDLKLC